MREVLIYCEGRLRRDGSELQYLQYDQRKDFNRLDGGDADVFVQTYELEEWVDSRVLSLVMADVMFVDGKVD